MAHNTNEQIENEIMELERKMNEGKKDKVFLSSFEKSLFKWSFDKGVIYGVKYCTQTMVEIEKGKKNGK